MIMNKGKLVLAVGVLGAAHLFAASADENWGQWRGPSQNGVAPKADPPIVWSESKNVKWKFKLAGEGSASPIVWDNHVFIQSAVPVAKKLDAKVNLVPQFAGQD